MPPGPAHTLDRFVPRVASEWDLDAPGTRWQELDGSLCFVDISGFTALSERLAMRGRIGVEELTDVLNRVFGRMLDIAFERGGSLLKFGGDALLLLFVGDDHPQQAAAAAVEMRAALRTAIEEPLSVGRVQLRMSVGLHSGTVQLFRVGTLHQELIVTGPAATRTTEMEHAASAGEIFVSPEMARRLPPQATKPGPPAPRSCGGGERRSRPPGPACTAIAARRDRRCLPPGHPPRAPEAGRGRVRAPDRGGGVHPVSGAWTRSSSSEGPDAVADALHAVVSTVQAAADEAGVAFLASDIDEDGGKIILVSGVPRAQADHEGRLLRALRSIADADLPLPLQIGVNDGHVFAGTIGATHRATFTVMGDTVNLAARLMSAAPAGEVYATAGVLDRSRARSSRRAPSSRSRSRARRSRCRPTRSTTRSADAATADQEGPVRRPSRGAAAGRRGACSAAGDAPDGGVLTIVGDTGMGKSRLVTRGPRRRPACSSFTVRGEPDGTTSPYRAFRDSIRALLGIERADQATMAAAAGGGRRPHRAGPAPVAPAHRRGRAHPIRPSTPEVEAIEPRFLPDQRAAAVDPPARPGHR